MHGYSLQGFVNRFTCFVEYKGLVVATTTFLSFWQRLMVALWYCHFSTRLRYVLSGTFHYTFCCEDFNCVKAYSLMNNMTKTNFYLFELNSWFIVSFFSRSHLVGSKRQASNTILQVLHHVVLVGRSLLTAITIF